MSESEIDWDGLIGEASDSPRALLAEVLAEADDIEEVVIVWRREDGTTGTFWRCDSQSAMIGMLEYAKWFECLKVHGSH